MAIGDVFRMSSWQHIEGAGRFALRWRMKVEDKNQVGVFLYLGVENKDGTQPLDLEKRMNELGWFVKKPDPAHSVNKK